ncbi:uncharacterized protein isoform X1 [Danio rerio]|uniref:Uncharacterized protein isoform X1 n=1 Tax=Danio rerio TaxID=7955 RepID=A0A8M9Q3P7_DANRE|nr:uncharacterized protein LOC110440004 [Danio rerio]|eukprot:XP_021334028.1 uncharacterized protein LOC110440004 [Danio rerio]
MFTMPQSALAAFYFSLFLAEAVPPADIKRSGCIKVNQCKCLMLDGSGLIDLGSVADEDGFLLRFTPLPSETGDADVLLSLSPCLSFSQPEDFTATECTDVAACVITKTHQDNRLIDQYLNYGRHEGSKFSYNDTTKTLSVTYFLSPELQPQTVVHYRCGPNRLISSSWSVGSDSGSSLPLQMWVESPCACPSACALVDVGPGTIILIILCLTGTAYFITGSCALRPFRSSNGVLMAPEDSVWCMICHRLSEGPGAASCSLRDPL